MADSEALDGASGLNRELTLLIVAAGSHMGFEAQTEFPVAGARLDVVWLWTPPAPIPGLQDPLVVAAFEIESSWRTRKHVKGDLINLQDVGPALGVIVLAGADPRDDALRRFALNLVDRPGPRILIWTEDDVRSLAAGEPRTTAFAEAAAAAAKEEPVSAPPPELAVGRSYAVPHDGKYSALWQWLCEQPKSERSLSFGEVEQILGFDLPPSCRDHEAHWYSYEGSAVTRAIIDAGWHASRVRLKSETLNLVPGPPTTREL
jgi:hypothetical protein